MMKLSDTLEIREVLMTDATLGVTAVTPIVAYDITKYPYISYQRKSVEMSMFKRGDEISSAIIDVAVWSDDYDQTIVIAERVLQLLCAKGYTIITVNEVYESGAYAQVITVEVQ